MPTSLTGFSTHVNSSQLNQELLLAEPHVGRLLAVSLSGDLAQPMFPVLFSSLFPNQCTCVPVLGLFRLQVAESPFKLM